MIDLDDATHPPRPPHGSRLHASTAGGGLNRKYGLLALVWAAFALVYYLVFIVSNYWFEWGRATRTTLLLVLPVVLALLAAGLPSARKRPLPVFWGVLALALFLLWSAFHPHYHLIYWFGWMALWVCTGGALAHALLWRWGLRLPFVVGAALYLASAMLLQYFLSACFALARPWLLMFAAHALWVAPCLWFKADFARPWRGGRNLRTAGWPALFLAGLIGSCTAFFLLVGQLPEIVSDARVYLPLLRLFLQNGRHVYQPWAPFSYYPNGWYHLYFVPYALGGEEATKAFNVLVSVLLMSAVWRIVRRLLGGLPGLFVVLAIYTLPMFQWLWYVLYQDALTLFFTAAGLVLLLELVQRGQWRTRRLALVAGVLWGAALTCKLSPLIGMAAGAGALWLGEVKRDWHARGARAALLRPTLLLAGLGATALLVSAPSWVPPLRLAHDPIFPLLTPLSEMGRHRVPIRDFSWCLNPFTWALLPYYGTFASSNAIDYHLNGALGPWLWMLFPFIPLNLMRRSPLRGFLLLFALCFWALMFLGREFLVRYHLPFYAVALLLCASGVHAWAREQRALRWRGWPWLLCAAGTGCVMLCMMYGYAVYFNFERLPGFLKSKDRHRYIEQEFPKYNRVLARVEQLAPRESVVLSTNRSVMAIQLPRYAFGLESFWLAYDLSRLGWNDPAQLVRASGAALEILPTSDETTSPTFYFNWPPNATWRRPANLINARDPVIFALKGKYKEPGVEFNLSDLAATTNSAARAAFALDLGSSTGLYRAALPARQKVLGFAAIWDTPTTGSALVLEQGPGRTIPVVPTEDVNYSSMRRYYRQRLAVPNETLQFVSGQPLDAGDCRVSLISDFNYPANETPLARPSLVLPTRWSNDMNEGWRLEPNFWLSPHAGAPHTTEQPLNAGNKHWGAYRLKGADCSKVQAVFIITAATAGRCKFDLRFEGSKYMGDKILRSMHAIRDLRAGSQVVRMEWDWPGNVPGSKSLTLIVWPEGEGDWVRIDYGVMNFLP